MTGTAGNSSSCGKRIRKKCGAGYRKRFTDQGGQKQKCMQRDPGTDGNGLKQGREHIYVKLLCIVKCAAE